MRNIVIVGGDKRLKYLKDYLTEAGFTVSSYGLFDWDDDTDRLKSEIGENSLVVLPIPATRNDRTINMPFSKREITIDRLLSFLGKDNLVFGGIIKGELLSHLREVNIPYIDYYDSDFIEKNAVLTAYGVLKILLEHIDFALPMGRYAITGYGRVAKETVKLLNALSCDVTVFARSSSQREDACIRGAKALPLSILPARAKDFDIIINTIPATIMTEETIENIRKGCKVVELASAPYGMDFELMRKRSVDVIKAFGLPGKYTPKTAGEIIGKKIELYAKEE